MGDSACIIRSFSYAPAMPNESKQGNLMLALGDSVSFGRFMNESLSWEKWSTFSQKNYVEEAERYAQPGSVAQKKAFFEAHYKRKVGVLVEQGSGNELEAEGVVHDNDEQVRLDAQSDVNGGRLELEKVEQGMGGGAKDCNEQCSVPVEETSNNGQNGVICSAEILEESCLKSSPGKLLNLENQDDVSSWRSPTPKQDQNDLSEKDVCSLSVMNDSKQMKSWKDMPTLAKQVPPHCEQDNSDTKSLRRFSVDSGDIRVSSSKSLSALINLNQGKELKEGPISASPELGNSELAHNSTMAHVTPWKTPITAQSDSESTNLAVTTQSENNRMSLPLNSSASGSKSASRKWHLLSAVFSKSLAERSASNRKHKIEEKFNASEVQKMQQEKEMKDQAGNRFSKLSCIFCFKASPTLDVDESADRIEQGIVSMLPPPPPPPLSRVAKNSSMGNGNDKANCHSKSFTATIAHENAPPNIQQ